MQIKKIITNTLLITMLTGTSVPAANFDYLNPADPAEVKQLKNSHEESLYSTSPQKAVLTQNAIHNQYEIALQRFMQANVKSAYMDFKMLIRHVVPNDFVYLKIADNMAEIGLFNLSNEALDRISDKNISNIHIDDLKRFYYPKMTLTSIDEIYLAEVYSNIMYNAQSKEATAELIKNTELLNKSDYANYIAALGSLKTGDIKNAQTYINNALKINPDNVNYQKLKIEVLLENDNSKEALKVLENIKKHQFYTSTYISKIDVLEKYAMYKISKDDTLKKYYLGYYYYLTGDDFKAIRTLQGAISSKKKTNRYIYGLMAEVYYHQKEFEKAQNFAEKSLQAGGKDTEALLVMGKVNYRNNNYKEAIKSFKSIENSNTEALVWTAMSYSAMGEEKSAKEIYYKILREHNDCPQAYYHIALIDKDRQAEYLTKAIALNLNYIDGWVELARLAIEKNNLLVAGKYLGIVKYIDENDFRYYYYQGLVYKANGLYQDANYYFRKSLALNPNNELAKKELGI